MKVYDVAEHQCIHRRVVRSPDSSWQNDVAVQDLMSIPGRAYCDVTARRFVPKQKDSHSRN